MALGKEERRDWVNDPGQPLSVSNDPSILNAVEGAGVSPQPVIRANAVLDSMRLDLTPGVDYIGSPVQDISPQQWVETAKEQGYNVAENVDNLINRRTNFKDTDPDNPTLRLAEAKWKKMGVPPETIREYSTSRSPIQSAINARNLEYHTTYPQSAASIVNEGIVPGKYQGQATPDVSTKNINKIYNKAVADAKTAKEIYENLGKRWDSYGGDPPPGLTSYLSNAFDAWQAAQDYVNSLSLTAPSTGVSTARIPRIADKTGPATLVLDAEQLPPRRPWADPGWEKTTEYGKMRPSYEHENRTWGRHIKPDAIAPEVLTDNPENLIREAPELLQSKNIRIYPTAKSMESYPAQRGLETLGAMSPADSEMAQKIRQYASKLEQYKIPAGTDPQEALQQIQQRGIKTYPDNGYKKSPTWTFGKNNTNQDPAAPIPPKWYQQDAEAGAQPLTDNPPTVKSTNKIADEFIYWNKTYHPKMSKYEIEDAWNKLSAMDQKDWFGTHQ